MRCNAADRAMCCLARGCLPAVYRKASKLFNMGSPMLLHFSITKRTNPVVHGFGVWKQSSASPGLNETSSFRCKPDAGKFHIRLRDAHPELDGYSMKLHMLIACGKLGFSKKPSAYK